MLPLLAALVMPLAACERETQHVVVSLYSQGLSATASMLFTYTRLGSLRTLVQNRYTRQLDAIDLQLPDDAQGEVDFNLESRDAFGEVLARGSASTVVTGPGRYKVEVPLLPLSPPTVLLRDGFDDGDIATNHAPGGIGNGFVLTDIPWNGVSDKHVSEVGGVAQVSGGSLGKALISNDGFDPNGTTLIGIIPKRPHGSSLDGGLNGATVGWFPDPSLCCNIGVQLSMHDGQLTFDLQPRQDFQPRGRYVFITPGADTDNATLDSAPATDILFSIELGVSSWKVDALGPGMEVHQQGVYNPGFALSDIMAVAGGPLRPTASFFRQNSIGTVDSLLVTRP